MNWIIFLWTITAVTVNELETLIRDTSKNDIFDFTTTAITPILALAKDWQQNWTEMFKKILERVKTEKGYNKDKGPKNGTYTSLPFPEKNKEFMVIFFIPADLRETKRFLVYDFKIAEKK